MKLRHLRAWAMLLGAGPAIAVHAASPIYVGAQGLYKSTDAGATWANVNVPLNNPLLSGTIFVLSLSMDPHDPSKIYFIGHATAWAFFATPDAGQSWSATPFVGLVPQHVAVDFAGKVIYVTATSAGSAAALLYSSTDTGATWTRHNLPNPSNFTVDSFVPDPTVSGTIYALTGGGQSGFFRSVDFGTTWTHISGPGVTLTSGGIVPQTTINGIVVDPTNPLTWYDFTDHSSNPASCPLTNGGLCGLFKSTDGGASFTGLSIPSDYVSSVRFGATLGTVYATADVAGLGGTVMKSADGGGTWTPRKNGLFTSQNGRVWADPTDASTLYVSDSIYPGFYVSTDAGGHFTNVVPSGPAGCVPGNCSRQTIQDVLIAGVAGPPPFVCTNTTPPVITFIDSGSSFGGYPYFASGSWLEIKGSNLADPADPRVATGSGQWASGDFSGVNAPTTLDGISVSINGKPAYVWYLSAGQINVQAPEDTLIGNAVITVTNCKATSSRFTFARQALAPGLLAPPNYTAGGTQYMVATFVSDGAYVLNTSTGATFGLDSRAAKPGDQIVAYGIGFGDVTPSILPGVVVQQSNSVTNSVTFSFGSVNATLSYFGLAGGFIGLYEFYLTVPPGLANGDYQINVTQNGTALPQTMYLTVHN